MAKTLLQFAAEFGDPMITGIADELNNQSLLMPRLPIKKINGLIEKHGILTYQGGVSTRSIGAAFPAVQGSTIAPGEERCMIAGSPVTTDARLVSANPLARGNEIARRTKAVAAYVDDQVLHGAGTTDQQKIVGLNDRLTGNQVIPAGTNGAVITLDLFHAMIDAVIDQGNGRFALLNLTCWRKLKNAIITAAGGATVSEVAQGVFVYEGVSIVIARQDHEGNELLAFDETQGNIATAASAYCFAPGTSTDDTGVQLIMASNSIEVRPEGIHESQYVDVVEVAVGLGLYHPRAASRLKGLKAS